MSSATEIKTAGTGWDLVKIPLRLDKLSIMYNPQVKIPLTPGALLGCLC